MKKIKIAMLSILFLLVMSFPTMAKVNPELAGVDESQVVYDAAGVIQDEEALKTQANSILDQYGIYVGFITANDITQLGYDKNYIDDYVNDWYDSNEFVEDAVFFAVDITNRKYCIITKGSAIGKIDGSVLENVEDAAYHYLVDSDYEAAMNGFVHQLDSEFSGKKLISYILFLTIPLAIGLVTLAIMFTTSKSSHISRPSTKEYIDKSKTIITKRNDRYIRTATQVRNINKDSSSGGSVSSGNSSSGGTKGSF